MIDFLYSAAGFVVALGILVTIHEFGHFWVARRLGVKVLRFSVGFGKPLWTRRVGRDGVEFVIGAVPLGGYVKMLDENEGEVAPEERARAFNRQSLVTRSLIVLAGPMANFVFAAVAYTVLSLIGIEGIVPVVGEVAESSLAAQSGFQAGDRIEKIDGRAVRSWDERRMYLFNRALSGAVARFEVRDAQGRRQERELDLSKLPVEDLDGAFLERGAGLYPIQPAWPAVIEVVQAGSPADAAGLRAGDLIVSLDGAPVASWPEVVRWIRARPGRPVVAAVERDGATVELSVTPEAVDSGGQTVGRIGVVARPLKIPADMRVTVRYGPLEAVSRGVEITWVMSALTVKMLYRMLQLEVSAKNISGPLTIAQVAGDSAQLGLDRFLAFLAVVSISLGVLNLLPIPILDGGHLLYYVAEAIKGGPLPQRVMLWGQQIGILLLVGLMGLAFYNDIARMLQ